jgi:hypothetical protein
MAETTAYFRIPAMLDHAAGPRKDGTFRELGRPERVTRNFEYEPDGNGVIAVTDAEDIDAFRREQGYVELVPSGDLPAPEATVKASVVERADLSNATGAKKASSGK